MKEKYMKIAIKLADKALKLGEMPVGAVIVCNDEIISKGYNKKEKNKNSLMHAEMIAIHNACKYKKDWRLDDCEMYVTMEPCTMCMGAICESRIKKVYCGAANKKSHNLNLKICKSDKIKLEINGKFKEIDDQIKTFFEEIRGKQTNVRK